LSDSEVSTVMDNIQIMREKLHQTDKEKENLKQRVSSLSGELEAALKDEKVNVHEVASKLAEEKIR